MSVLGPTLRHTIHAADANLGSVRSSNFARCTIGNHELKLLQALEGAENDDYVTTYKEFRRKLLVKDDPIRMATLSRPKKNIAKLKMAVCMLKGKKLAFLSKAQLAFSPLNPANKNDTTALMMKIRQMKLQAGLEPEEEVEEDEEEEEDGEAGAGEVEGRGQTRRLRGVDLELSDPVGSPSSLPRYDSSMDSRKEKEVEKAFRYVVGEYASSPFTSRVEVAASLGSDSPGRGGAASKAKRGSAGAGDIGVQAGSSLKQRRSKGFIKNAQALRKKKGCADQKAVAAKNDPKGKVKCDRPESRSEDNLSKPLNKKTPHPYPVDNYSEHQQQQQKQQEQKQQQQEQAAMAKLPDRLRRACDKKYAQLMAPVSERSSYDRHWARIVARRSLLREKESLTIMGALGQSFSPAKSLPQFSVEEHPAAAAAGGAGAAPQGGGRPAFRRNPAEEDDLLGGDALLFAMERDGLFTVDDLDCLSQTSEHSEELLSDGSEAGLFNTLDLLHLDVVEQDPVLQHEDDVRTPDGALAASMGALLFSRQLREEVSTRPASAGLGGVTRSVARPALKPAGKQDLFSYHHKYSVEGVVRRRPQSANTSPHVRSSGDFEEMGEIPNHVQKKRLVVNRHRTPEVWIS